MYGSMIKKAFQSTGKESSHVFEKRHFPLNLCIFQVETSLKLIQRLHGNSTTFSRLALTFAFVGNA
jgi:hypothetical protein